MDPKEKLLQEALACYRKAGYEGICLLPTGSGKGKLMIELAKELNPKSILYLSNTQLLRDKMFPDELYKWDAAYLLPRMELQCYQTACKWVGRHYDLLLADEFDAALTPKYSKVFKNNTFGKRIMVSATLDDAKLKQAKKIAPIVFERKPIETQGVVTNKARFFFINYNLMPEENGFYLNYNLQFKKLLNQFKTKEIEQKLTFLKIQRKQFLSKLKSGAEVCKWLIKTLEPKNEKILIFCGLSEQADKVCKYSYHSINDNLHLFDAFNGGKIKTLAVVDKVNRGLNIADIRNIVFESIGQSKTKLTQRIGRGMRLEVQETLNVFFLVPYFLDLWGHRKPSIVMNWILDATQDMDLTDCKTIEYKK